MKQTFKIVLQQLKIQFRGRRGKIPFHDFIVQLDPVKHQGHDRNALLDNGTGHDVDMIMQFSRRFFDQPACFFRTADRSFAVIQHRGHHGRRHPAKSSYVFQCCHELIESPFSGNIPSKKKKNKIFFGKAACILQKAVI